MTKKKIKIFIISLLIIIIAIVAYILLLSKPQVTVISVNVESLSLYTEPTHRNYIEGRNPVEGIEYFIESARKYGDADVQAFVNSDNLPSDNPADYVKVTLNLETTNRSIFDSYSVSSMVNGGEDLYEYCLVTISNITPYEVERLSTSCGYTWSFYIYTKGKSASEIEEFIRGIEFQFPFSNDILKNSNQYFKIDENATFSFNGV